VFSVLFYVFWGICVLAGVGAALQFRDGGPLFGAATVLLGVLILDYLKGRRKFLGIYSYLKDHKGRIVFLIVVLLAYVISVWTLFAKGS